MEEAIPTSATGRASAAAAAPVRPEPAEATQRKPPSRARRPARHERCCGIDRPRSSPPPPCARARELGIDLAEVQPPPTAPPCRSRRLLSTTAAASATAPRRRARDETIKVVGLRRRIAENMAAAKRNIPHFTYVEECDVTELEDTRAMINQPRRQAQADAAAAADRRDLPGAARSSRCSTRATTTRRAGHPPRRGPSRHGDADRGRADGPGDPRRAGARTCGSSRARSRASPKPRATARRSARNCRARPSPCRSARSAGSPRPR